MNRREFIVASGSSLLLPAGSEAFARTISREEAAAMPYPISNNPPPIWDLWLIRQANGKREEYREKYVEHGQVYIPGYVKLCEALRDVHAPAKEQVVQMDLKLLNLLFAVQQWMKINGQYRPLIVNSGYRTSRSNANLENAAKNSMHLYGKAADFYIENLPTKYLGELVKFFKEGGMGLYLSKNFVHADTGAVRTWNG